MAWAARLALLALLAGCGPRAAPGSGSSAPGSGSAARPLTAAHQRVTLSRATMRPLDGGGYAINFAYLSLERLPEAGQPVRVPPRIRALVGQPVELEGHVLALRMDGHLITDFLLTRYSRYECCFGAVETASDVVRVTLAEGRGIPPIHDSETVIVRGTMQLSEERDAVGTLLAVYRIEGAEVRRPE